MMAMPDRGSMHSMPTPGKMGEVYTLTDIPIVSEEEGRKNADVFRIMPYALFPNLSKGNPTGSGREERGVGMVQGYSRERSGVRSVTKNSG